MARSSEAPASSGGLEPAGPQEYQQYLEVAMEAAKEAGAIIKAAWNQPKRVEHKGVGWGAAGRAMGSDIWCRQLLRCLGLGLTWGRRISCCRLAPVWRARTPAAWNSAFYPHRP